MVPLVIMKLNRDRKTFWILLFDTIKYIRTQYKEFN